MAQNFQLHRKVKAGHDFECKSHVIWNVKPCTQEKYNFSKTIGKSTVALSYESSFFRGKLCPPNLIYEMIQKRIEFYLCLFRFEGKIVKLKIIILPVHKDCVCSKLN